MNPPFRISFAEGDAEKKLAAEFVASVYFPIYNALPPIADVYAVVQKDGVIASCMALETKEVDGRFQIEKTYGIKRHLMPLKICGENGVELVRWSSPSDPKAGLLAVRAAVTYGLQHGKLYGLVEHDRRIHRHCERSLGIKFHSLNHSNVDLSALPPALHEFYGKNTMKPYLVELKQMHEALLQRTKDLLFTGL